MLIPYIRVVWNLYGSEIVWEFEWVECVTVIALAGLFDLDCHFMTVLSFFICGLFFYGCAKEVGANNGVLQ